MTERQLHFGLNVLSDGMHPAAWQFPDSDPNSFVDPAYWIGIAQLAERGTLDAIFLADSPSLFQPPDAPLTAPPLAVDPIVLLSTMASATTHLGLIGVPIGAGVVRRPRGSDPAKARPVPTRVHRNHAARTPRVGSGAGSVAGGAGGLSWFA